MMLNEVMQEADQRADQQRAVRDVQLPVDVRLLRAQAVPRLRQLDAAAEPGGVHARHAAVRFPDRPPRPRASCKPIAQPQIDFASIPDVFQKALEQEQDVTEQINSLYEMAFNEKAFAALVELEWFINEQVEEEKTARDIVYKFQLVKDDPAALLDLDRELGARQPAAPRPPARTEVCTIAGCGIRVVMSILCPMTSRILHPSQRAASSLAPSAPPPIPFPCTVPNPPKRRISRYRNRHASSIATSEMISSAK